MNLMRIDPYRELDRFNRALGSAFAFGRPDREDESLAAWVPPVDIHEEKERLVITAELPGFKENEISITTENGMLTISGERKFEKEEKNKKYHRVERSYGTFVRTFTLPDYADADRVSAEFKDGVLKVHLPKSEKAKPKQVEVKVA